MAKAKGKKEGLNAKPPLSEIFAALSGVTCAAVTVTRKGADTKYDALASAGYDSVMKTLEIVEKGQKDRSLAAQDVLAKDALQFLGAAASVLTRYPETHLSLPSGSKGGKTQDLIQHIDEMLEREKNSAEPRALEKFLNGALQSTFNARYLPKPNKKDLKETEYKGEGEDDPEAAPVSKEKAPHTKAKKPKTYAWNRPQSPAAQ